MADTDIEPVRRRTLDKGRTRVTLIRDLATDTPVAELAAKHGVTLKAIYLFRDRHLDAIEAARNNFGSEFAGLWIADKSKRLAEIESVAAHIDGLMSEELAEALDEWAATEDPDEHKRRLDVLAESSVGDPQVLRIKLAALKQAAEELGQIPTKTTVEVKGSVVNYVVEGVAMDNLT